MRKKIASKTEAQQILEVLEKTMSLEELAVAMGLSFYAVERWRRGDRQPHGPTLEKLRWLRKTAKQEAL